MFGSDLLGVAIGLALVYLMLSIICTTANELLEGQIKNRAKDLQCGINEMFGGNLGAETIVASLYQHALIFDLFSGDYNAKKLSNLPSYVPAHNFALALLDVIQPATANSRFGATEDLS